MRSMWNGSLSFGLVNIPVKMYAATQGKDPRFNQLHSVCHTPIKYEKVCPHCQRAVVPERLSAATAEPGRYVIIQDEEWEDFCGPGNTHRGYFALCGAAEIDPIYYEKTYYLEPTDTGVKPIVCCRRLCCSRARSRWPKSQFAPNPL